MEIITKIEQASKEELLDVDYINENILNGLCQIDVEQNPQVKGLLKELWVLYYEEQSDILDSVKLKLDSMLYQISCIGLTNENAKIPECFEYPYFWHYYFAIAFPLASDDVNDVNLCDLIQDQYPLQEVWLEQLFKDEPLQLELDDQTLTIKFEHEEVKFLLGEEEVFALFDYDTLSKLTKDDEVLFMLLLPIVLNEPNNSIEKSLFKIVEEFPIYEGLHQKVTNLLIKHITTEV